MNRTDFQAISTMRLLESKALLAAGFPQGAYYLAGYAVECALKACIAKKTQQHDFPQRKLANDSHTHDLEKLLSLADVNDVWEVSIRTNASLKSNWIIIQDWSETSRYESKTPHEAEELLRAIEDETGGLLQWVRQRW